MAEQGCIQKFCQGGGANLGYGKKRGGEFGVWKEEGGRKLTIVLCEAQGGATPYTCYAGMLVSLWRVCSVSL